MVRLSEVRGAGSWFSMTIVAVMGVASGACGGSTAGNGIATTSDGGTSPTGADGGSASGDGDATSAPPPDALGAYAIDGILKSEETNMPLPGASVCLFDIPTVCTTTDATGAYALRGIGAVGSGVVASAGGDAPGIFPVTTTADLHGFDMYIRTPARVRTLAASVGATFGSTGAIHFEGRDGSDVVRAGVSVSVASSTGATVSYYVGPGKLSTTATATGTLGDGYIFGLPEGTVTLTFSAPSSTCTRRGYNDWPSAAGGTATMTLPIRAGAVTRAAAVCP